MALNVISNFAANVAHRNLVASDMKTTSSLAKLSSGLRVVSAKDDAASLAIGSRLRAEVAAMQQATQNASQASSLLQIADGALATIGDILVRMKALAVQASSGQFGTTERAVLDSEYQALLSEITRISDDTEFNGTQLIAGGSAVFDANNDMVAGDQTVVGTTNEFTAGQAPGVSVQTLDTTVVTTGDTFRMSYNNTSEELSLTNTRTGDRQTIDITTAFNAQLTANGQATTDNTLNAGTNVDVNFNNLGVTVRLDSVFNRTNATINTEGNQAVTVGANASATTSTVAYGTTGFDITGLRELVGLDTGTSFAVATGILTINYTGNAGANTLALAATNGLEFSVDGGVYGAAPADDLDDGAIHTIDVRLATSTQVLGRISLDTASATGTGAGTLTLDIGELIFGTAFTSTGTSQNFDFKVGTGAATQDTLTFTVSAASANALSLGGTVITDASSANTASTAVTAAIDTINQQRSTVGAAQNRLSFASNNLAAAIENSEAARSGLLDLDVAKEISDFTSKNILVQTGISMLAQANQVPQNLLRLFQ
ncbi:MAG: flagellin [Alphaproteobacteria bacterium]|nr:flagellin [Alphaproteobacteria bacterium]